MELRDSPQKNRSEWQCYFITSPKAELPNETVWLCSLDNHEKGTTAGRVVPTDRENAAVRIVEKTHRLATEEEIAADAEEQQRKREAIAATEAGRRKVFKVPHDLPSLLKAAQAENAAGGKRRGP